MILGLEIILLHKYHLGFWKNHSTDKILQGFAYDHLVHHSN